MPRRSRKSRPTDQSESAQVAADQPPADATLLTPDGKNAAAVYLGRLGGKKGGHARAAKLTKEQRSEIAKKAARARWTKATQSKSS
jgi:hypothetical protein